MFRSVTSDAKEVTHDIEVLKVILLVEVSVVLSLPEATGTHMETTLAFLEANESSEVLVIR